MFQAPGPSPALPHLKPMPTLPPGSPARSPLQGSRPPYGWEVKVPGWGLNTWCQTRPQAGIWPTHSPELCPTGSLKREGDFKASQRSPLLILFCPHWGLPPRYNCAGSGGRRGTSAHAHALLSVSPQLSGSRSYFKIRPCATGSPPLGTSSLSSWPQASGGVWLATEIPPGNKLVCWCVYPRGWALINASEWPRHS